LSTQLPVDELMIDWGRIPAGSTASIDWPQVPAVEVVSLASSLYGRHGLTAAGDHTIRCQITGGVTYVPIPRGAGENFAGLLTVDLPATVVTGQEFDVVVRRVAVRDLRRLEFERATEGAAVGVKGRAPWRHIVGTFQVKIPVATAATMLGPEEDTLAILRWRLEQMPPSDRWHPVLTRYVKLIAGRVAGLGGDPSQIAPSPRGAAHGRRRRCDDVVDVCGRIALVRFDCHGDLEGFVLEECCEQHTFRTRETRIGDIALRAARDHLTVTVTAFAWDRSRIKQISIHG